jgi:hypothetical protein
MFLIQSQQKTKNNKNYQIIIQKKKTQKQNPKNPNKIQKPNKNIKT